MAKHDVATAPVILARVDDDSGPDMDMARAFTVVIPGVRSAREAHSTAQTLPGYPVNAWSGICIAVHAPVPVPAEHLMRVIRGDDTSEVGRSLVKRHGKDEVTLGKLVADHEDLPA